MRWPVNTLRRVKQNLPVGHRAPVAVDAPRLHLIEIGQPIGLKPQCYRLYATRCISLSACSSISIRRADPSPCTRRTVPVKAPPSAVMVTS